MNTYKTIIIIFILKKLFCLMDLSIIQDSFLCELSSNQSYNTTIEIMGAFYFKTEEYFYLRDIKDSTFYDFQTYCLDNISNKYYLVLKEEKSYNSIYLQTTCKKDFDVINKKKQKYLEGSDNFEENLLKSFRDTKNYQLIPDFEQSIKKINDDHTFNNFVILKVKNLKEFLENLKIFYRKKIISYEIECIKSVGYNSVNYGNYFYEPLSFIVYLNFHKKKLYDGEQIKIKSKNNINFYHKFMNSIISLIFKFESEKIYIKKTDNFIFTESEILFFKLTKIKKMTNFTIEEIFAKFIYKFLESNEKDCFSNLFPLLKKSYIYFFKNYKTFYLDFMMQWKEFKDLLYKVIINSEQKDTIKHMRKFHKFVSKFYAEAYDNVKNVSEEKQGSNFELDRKFAVQNIPTKISSEDIDEKSLILKLFGYDSEGFFFIFPVFFIISIFIIF